MMAKELRQSLRRGSFVVPFLGIQALAVAAMAAEFHMGYGTGSAENAGMLNIAMFWSSGPFWVVVASICVVMMPLAGLLLMGQELEEGNHELLLLTKLDRWKIVTGKFLTLWGLSSLTFVSLLPYVVVRYMLGGVEWRHELACSATVLGGSAILAAGAIGASAFRSPAARVLVFLLFLGSMLVGGAGPLAASRGISGSFGWFYHFNAICTVICYVAVGLALARSRLRLTVAAYETQPSGMVIGLMVFSPFVILMATVVSAGFLGGLGLLGIALAAVCMDVTPKVSKRFAPVSNVPVPGGAANEMQVVSGDGKGPSLPPPMP